MRVAVAAATVNPTDIGLRAGIRREGLDPFRRRGSPGMELAGTIDAVGPGGDSRSGQRGDGDRARRSAPAAAAPGRAGRRAGRSVAPIPDGASLVQAATLPMNGLTVRLALDTLALAGGQDAAITGAAGAVGGYAIELAKPEGLTVIADAAAGRRGAGPRARRGRRRPARRWLRRRDPRRLPRRRRRGDRRGAAGPGDPSRRARRRQLSPCGRSPARPSGASTIQRVLVSSTSATPAALAELGRLAGEGRFTLRVAETYPPEQRRRRPPAA